MFFFKLKLLLLIFIAGFTISCGFAAVQHEIRIGVLALRGKVICLKLWEPTAVFLTANIPGYKFKIVPLAYSEINDSVANKKIDFILVNSSIYVLLEMDYNVSRIASMEKSYKGNYYNEYGGIIFCLRSNNSINKLADLKGRSFIASDETSFGGWQMAWRLLQQNNINPYRDFSSVQFGGNNDAVVMAVKTGKAAAGTVTSGILESMVSEGRVNLEDFRVIHRIEYPTRRFPLLCSTQLYPEWPFAELPHVPHGLGEKVMVALTQMKPEEDAAVAAGIAGWSAPLNYTPVNECLKELRIGPYRDFGKITLSALWKEYRIWFMAGFVFFCMVLFFSVYACKVNRRLRVFAARIEQELAERKRAEEEIRQIFNTAGDGMRVVGPGHRIIEVNEQYLTMSGFPRNEVIGHNCQEFSACDETRCDSDECTFKKMLDLPQRMEHDFILKAKTGSIPCIVTSVPYYGREGKVIGMIQNFKDIRDRLRAEEASEQEAEQRGRALMAGSVLHDIGNAVTGIGTLAVKHIGDTGWPEIQSMSMLRKMFNDQSEALEHAFGMEKLTKLQAFLAKLEESLTERKTIIQETSQKMAGMVSHINDVLSLQRIYAGGSKVQPSRVSLKQLAEDAAAMLSASFQKREIKLVFKVDPDVQEIKVDKTRIIQVLINLLKNAAESFDLAVRTEDRRIEIAIRQESDQQIMEITDNAAGFDPAHAGSFFENGFSTKNRSSGIGLYQCASIIKSHGGNIELSSAGLEQGATVKVTLPLETTKITT
ncbi:MAG: PhnD/SsuA/transferrin family substrate-binding protein [Lentisphaerota bacterium]